MSKRKKIAALVPNVLGFSPGQRVRIELWAKYLENAGWDIEFFPFEDDLLHEVLYGGGKSIQKIIGLLRCYEKQFKVIRHRLSADIIFIYREASLIGPAFLERLAAWQNIPVIFDLDDPIFLPYKSPANSWASLLKFSRKTHKIFRLSTHVIAINKLIGDYAAQFNPNVTVIPNCIDTDRYVPKPNPVRNGTHPSCHLVWIGSQSTMQNLGEIVEPIRKLQNDYNAPLTIIGSGNVNFSLEQIDVRQWSAENEIGDLQRGNIGLLPLNDLPWNSWKFFFKTIQYMAVGIPVIARRMGSNAEVIDDGIDGFLVETLEEWYDRLRFLTTNPEIRSQMGQAARRKVVEKYSLKIQMSRVEDLFNKSIAKPHNTHT